MIAASSGAWKHSPSALDDERSWWAGGTLAGKLARKDGPPAGILQGERPSPEKRETNGAYSRGDRSGRSLLSVLLLASAMALGRAATATAQTGDGYDLTWNTVGAGGGASGDAQYRVDGSIGEPDAGLVTLTDGTYSVTGGFWAGVSAGRCTGDCQGDGRVSIDELVTGVDMMLGGRSLDQCPSFDPDGDGGVTVADLIEAVSNALRGCG